MKEQDTERRTEEEDSRGEGLGWVRRCASKPYHLPHGGGNAPGEGKDPALQVNQEGVGFPAANHLDGAVGHARLVECHDAA